MKDVSKNEKDVKMGIVAANNHYGGYGPGTVDIFQEEKRHLNLCTKMAKDKVFSISGILFL